MSDDVMTKAERTELARLVRLREKLAKADVDRLVAVQLALLEQEFISEYHLDDDQVWEDAYQAAKEAVVDANALVAQRCRELGLRPEFSPSIRYGWAGQGEQAAKSRVADLRRVAKAKLDAGAKAAKVEIERASVRVQTELVAGGLQSADARAFLETMPTAEALLPPLTVAEIEAAS